MRADQKTCRPYCRADALSAPKSSSACPAGRIIETISPIWKSRDAHNSFNTLGRRESTEIKSEMVSSPNSSLKNCRWKGIRFCARLALELFLGIFDTSRDVFILMRAGNESCSILDNLSNFISSEAAYSKTNSLRHLRLVLPLRAGLYWSSIDSPEPGQIPNPAGGRKAHDAKRGSLFPMRSAGGQVQV